jgi:putative aldouronate transport system permease protein
MINKSKDYYVLQLVAYTLVGITALLCLIPFMLIISGSISKDSDIMRYGFNLIPKRVSFDAYKLIFKVPKVITNAYAVSIFITFVGAVTSLFITSMTAFVLMRKDFKYRNYFAFFFYFSSIFSGGMIPGYILVVNYLNLKNSLLALILPPLLGAWNIFLMRNFMSTIPDSIAESAKIDGANDFTIFLKLYLPLSKPGLATVGLFIGLMYWNDWFRAMMYIDTAEKFPLQYLLHRMLSSVKAIQDAADVNVVIQGELPGESLRMAMAVIATGPIILLYPFVQRYFVKGLTVGAVKG